MWEVKTFKTRAAMDRWIKKNDARTQWSEIAVNNGFGVEFRPLRIIG